MTEGDQAAARQAAEEVARASYGRLVAYLAARTRDVAAAEDALADAFVAALATWPDRGVPATPEAWLLTAARHRLVGAARRQQVRERAEPALRLLIEEAAERGEVAAVPDDRLRLLFACAHPAIDPKVHAPLMLQAVLGLDAARIASAFLVAPATMGQRLVRAKARLKDAGVPFEVPPPEALPARLDAVLQGVYAAYGSGWDDAAGVDARRRGLAEEAVRLARLLVDLLPDEPEARGLLALLLHCEARQGARRDDAGGYVPLAEQDVTRWSRPHIEEAERHLATAASARRLGRFQLEAAIQSVHALRVVTGRTDWAAISALYQGLLAVAPTIGAAVACAAAVAQASGAAEGLRRLDELADVAAGYQPWWAVRAHLLAELGRADDAAEAARRAAGLTEDPAVRAFLLARHGGTAGVRGPPVPARPDRSAGPAG